MGWASGVGLLRNLVSDINEYPDIGYDNKKLMFNILVDNFKNWDCDTVFELAGFDPVLDEVFKELYTDWWDDEL